MSENLLYHGLCLFVLFLTYLGSKGQKNRLSKSLEFVYAMIGLLILSDSMWIIASNTGMNNPFTLYTVNIVYFAAEIFGVCAWMWFTLETVDGKTKKTRNILLSLPAGLILLMTFTTPLTGFIFRIDSGEYIRGSLFVIDVIAKIGYLVFASIFAMVKSAKAQRRYLKKQYFLLASYGIPVIVAGALQAITGLDFNCVAPVIGLAVICKFGLSNEMKDDSDLVKAIAEAYSATFIINTDDNSVRTLSADDSYRSLAYLTETTTYEGCVKESVRKHVVPEDRLSVEHGFAIESILANLKEKNSYSVLYKVDSENSQEKYNKATFMKAFSDEDRHEIFLGIEQIETRQILLQERNDLENEKEEFEKIKESFTKVIANIIEARDADSGEHVLRVKEYTQYLCNQIMEDYPEYGLTPLKIRYITNGSALHDIGKIMIPDATLLKPGKLTKDEFEVMKTHCEKGCTILDKLPNDLDEDYIKYAKEICRWHHEKYDGKGYPDGLVGDEIPIAAQIVSLADCFDALTIKRVYKEEIPADEAFQMILDGQCGKFNEKLLECFSKVYKRIKEE